LDVDEIIAHIAKMKHPYLGLDRKRIRQGHYALAEHCNYGGNDREQFPSINRGGIISYHSPLYFAGAKSSTAVMVEIAYMKASRYVRHRFEIALNALVKSGSGLSKITFLQQLTTICGSLE